MRRLLFALLPFALGAAPITVTAGLYSVTANNTGNPGTLSFAFNGPSGVRNFVFAGVDAFIQLVLGDKGILVFTAELTADPIFHAISYTATPCNPCFYPPPFFNDPANTTGRGAVQFRPQDLPPGAYPPFYFGIPQAPLNLGTNSGGFLTGTLNGINPSFSGQYTWPIMISTPEPGTMLLSAAGLALLLSRRAKRRPTGPEGGPPPPRAARPARTAPTR
jgi:hypothetical protein